MESFLARFTLCSILCFKFVLTSKTGELLSYSIGAWPKLPEIYLTDFPYMSATVQIYINETSSQKRDESLIIIAPKNHGIMAFVRILHLKVSWKQQINDSQGGLIPIPECKDYLQFQTLRGSENHRQTQPAKICREVYENDLRLEPNHLIGPRVFHDPNGRTNISIHTDYYSSLPRNQTKVLAEVVFTAYSDCWSHDKDIETRRCSKNTSFSCIQASMFCDGKIQCAFEDNFAVDESNCNILTTMAPIFTNKDSSVLDSHVDSTDYQIRRYFIPTGLILFMVWGIITLIRKCYKCYKDDKEKEELYY